MKLESVGVKTVTMINIGEEELKMFYITLHHYGEPCLVNINNILYTNIDEDFSKNKVRIHFVGGEWLLVDEPLEEIEALIFKNQRVINDDRTK